MMPSSKIFYSPSIPLGGHKLSEYLKQCGFCAHLITNEGSNYPLTLQQSNTIRCPLLKFPPKHIFFIAAKISVGVTLKNNVVLLQLKLSSLLYQDVISGICFTLGCCIMVTPKYYILYTHTLISLLNRFKNMFEAFKQFQTSSTALASN